MCNNIRIPDFWVQTMSCSLFFPGFHSHGDHKPASTFIWAPFVAVHIGSASFCGSERRRLTTLVNTTGKVLSCETTPVSWKNLKMSQRAEGKNSLKRKKNQWIKKKNCKWDYGAPYRQSETQLCLRAFWKMGQSNSKKNNHYLRHFQNHVCHGWKLCDVADKSKPLRTPVLWCKLTHAVVVSVAAKFSHSGAQTFHQHTLSRVSPSTQLSNKPRWLNAGLVPRPRGEEGKEEERCFLLLPAGFMSSHRR